jgi:hypothetical protein
MSFPSNPNDNDIVEQFGRRFRYKSSKGAWDIISSPIVAPTVEAAPTTSSVAQAVNLPMSGNAVGSMAYSQDTNTLYVWNGSGWFKVALVNTNPTITDGGQATYELATDGTPTVVTLVANDPEGIPITWSYVVSSGSLEDTTVTNTGAVFTITPGVTAATFNLTFTASDGINVDTSVSSFTLSFIDWTTATLLHSITNPNTYGDTAADGFGYQSCGISGNYAVVGARSAADAGGNSSGMLYVFNVTTGALLHSIANPNASYASSNDMFSWPCAISGNYAIAGATDEENANGNGNNSGKAYILDVTTGALVYTLDNPNAYGDEHSDNFGASVSIFGNHAIVSAIGEDEQHGTAVGKAYIFKTTLGDWTDTTLLHTLDNPNAYGTSTYDYFGYNGYTVAIDSTHAIVGAFGENDAGGDLSGKAYIFNVATGALVHTLDNPNAYGVSTYDGFGQAVAISGNYAIVGAQDEQDAGGFQSGKAYIFNVATGALLHTLDNPNPAGTSANDQFGNAVSIEGDYAVVSARYEDAYSGRVYIFDVTTGTLIKTLVNPNANSGTTDDMFGYSLAMSGNHILVCAINEDVGATSSGQAYIFQAG